MWLGDKTETNAAVTKLKQKLNKRKREKRVKKHKKRRNDSNPLTSLWGNIKNVVG